MSNSLNKSQYLLYGYTKESQKECNLDCYIPDDVVDLMIFFYEQILTTNRPIVIDNGSAFIKSGFAATCFSYSEYSWDSEEDEPDDEEKIDADELPRSIFPTIIGRPRDTLQNKIVYVGEAASQHRDKLSTSYPIQGKFINNWDDMVCVYVIYKHISLVSVFIYNS